MLEQEGKLSLQDDITLFLPGYPTGGKPITVEHLLTHTSGIKSYTALPGWMERLREDVEPAEVVAPFQDEPMDFEPGSAWLYNNSGFFLLGLIIEKVSGKGYAEFLEEKIFAPLGMLQTSYDDPGQIIPRRARGYHRDESGFVNAPYISMAWPFSAGSLLSSVEDLVKWDRALYGEKILPQAALERMWTPYILSGGEATEYGYGWGIGEVAGKRVIQHGGGIHGFSSFALRIPEERLFIAVLSNNPENDPNPSFLAQLAASMILGEAPKRQPTEVPPAVLERYVGVYRVLGDQAVRWVTIEDGQLHTQRTGGSKFRALPAGNNEFFYEETLTRFRFEFGAEGKVQAMVMQPWGDPEERAVRMAESLPPRPTEVSVNTALYDEYQGVYELLPGFQITVTRDGDQLRIQGTNQPAIDVFPESETTFFAQVVDAKVVFVREGKNGEVSGLVLHQGGQTVPAKRLR
jgi:CubicO group peptidase (beta-lactamase class C family)